MSYIRVPRHPEYNASDDITGSGQFHVSYGHLFELEPRNILTGGDIEIVEMFQIMENNFVFPSTHEPFHISLTVDKSLANYFHR